MTEMTDSTFDEAACSVRAVIPPNTAVLVWRSIADFRDPFLVSVKVVDSGMTLDMPALLKRFKKRATNVYALDVK